MARFGIPRRPSVENDNESSMINWRRGLFRVWLLVSIAWIMAWIVYLGMNGLQGGFKTIGDLIEVPVLLFGPPIALACTRFG
jgi:hypothetical protein